MPNQTDQTDALPAAWPKNVKSLVPEFPISSAATVSSLKDPHVVTAKYPHHVWHVDLTIVPTSAGFWTAWFPFALLQVWPFCYWVAAVIDHYSRRVIGFAVFKKPPSSPEVRAFLGRAIHACKSQPKYIVTDKGSQFWNAGFKKWAKRKKIKLRYGAVGKHARPAFRGGSIAIVERFIRSLKTECTRRILVPLRLRDFREELSLYARWYNEERPHQSLDGQTPVEFGAKAPPTEISAAVPNSKLPRMELKVSFLNGRRHLPLVALRKVA